MPGDDPMGRAVEAMGRAVTELDAVRTSGALPHEMEALNQLLKAAAENRRRQVTRGAAGERRRRRQPLRSGLVEPVRSGAAQAPGDKLRDAEFDRGAGGEQAGRSARADSRAGPPPGCAQPSAARAGAQSRADRGRGAEAAARAADARAERAAAAGRTAAPARAAAAAATATADSSRHRARRQNGQERWQRSQDGRQLREISEDMRNAATGLRRQDSQQASDSGSRASERLRELERQIQTAAARRPPPRAGRPAARDASAGRLRSAVSPTRPARPHNGQPGDDARRRLAGEQDRLAQRVDRLEDQVKRLSKSGAGESEQRRATEDAARELERQKLADRMRQSAESLRQGSGKDEQAAPSPGCEPARRRGKAKTWPRRSTRSPSVSARPAGRRMPTDDGFPIS